MDMILSAPLQALHGTVHLSGSKSVSNRLLIMRALGNGSLILRNLSPSDDTLVLQNALTSGGPVADIGAAGTAMRFLTAYFAITEGTRILTGSARMLQRPVKILVDALHKIGADISYMGEAGYPPLQIRGKELSGGSIEIPADVSSQYISALMMIAPAMKKGLELKLSGKIASQPYISMTASLMRQLGIDVRESVNSIRIEAGKYSGGQIEVEGDWSAAAFFYTMAALRNGTVLHLEGLHPHSLQGDSVLMEIFAGLGVQSSFEGDVLRIAHVPVSATQFSYNFKDCPDLAQAVIVTCAALGIPGTFSGLESLRIKETDRTMALAAELQKCGVRFYIAGESWKLEGKAEARDGVTIRTYEDHRMAMSFAPLSLVLPEIQIEDPGVVTKSFPAFWDVLRHLGFSTAFSA